MKERYQPKHAKKKVGIPLSAYLIYILIATLLLTGVSFSKFVSSDSVNDGARVAIMNISAYAEENQSDNLNVDMTTENEEDQSASYKFTVTNDGSEVSMTYKIIVELPKEQLAGLAMTLTDSEGNECSCSVDGTVYTFDTGSVFEAGIDAYHEYILTFSGDVHIITYKLWDPTTHTYDYKSVNVNYPVENGSLEGVKLSVYAEQID